MEGSDFPHFDNPDLTLGPAFAFKHGASLLFEGAIESIEGRFAETLPPRLAIGAKGEARASELPPSLYRLGERLIAFSGTLGVEPDGAKAVSGLGAIAATTAPRAGDVVEIAGVGAPFEGAYRLAQTRLRFDLAGGWRLYFAGVREGADA